MNRFISSKIGLDQLETAAAAPVTDWLWDGYLARGNTTLLTSPWKAGKTTLLAGLLRSLAQPGEFLGRPCRPARALILSEEAPAHWAARQRSAPVGPHVELLSRPFRSRPTVAEWNELIDGAAELCGAGQLDLFAIDPLAPFLPGRCESDAGTLLEMLQPLHRLTGRGAAVLVLHHPRKEAAEEGSAARGSGALLGFVDIILELQRFGRLNGDANRRRLIALSRHAETPPRLAFEWNPPTGNYAVLEDLQTRRYRDNWDHLRTILANRQSAATQQELLANWPAGDDSPSATLLYEWLNRATAEKLVRREGTGRRSDPYRYRLWREEDDYFERGELPPLR